MSDLNSKSLRRRVLECGDRVRIRGVERDSPEYDEGVIESFTFSGARVHWELADETYSESLESLVSVTENARHRGES